jgi:hypothetical protein
MPVRVVDGREIGPLPGPDRAAAVQVEDEGDRLALAQVVRIVEIEFPSGLFVDRGDMAREISPLKIRAGSSPAASRYPLTLGGLT